MAHLDLSLFQTFQVRLAGQAVTHFRSVRVQALLAYLAVEGERPHRREALAGLLWPDQLESVARRNLSQTLLHLRQAIGDHEASPRFLLITRQTLQFNPASDWWLDVTAFTDHLAACQAHSHADLERCQPCIERLHQVVTLYQGEFLGDFFLADSDAFEEWALLKRETLHRRAVEALGHLASAYEQQGDYRQALHHARRQAVLEPLLERAHRRVMRILARSGQRSGALAQYEVCRRLLAEELGVEPAAETTELYEAIKTAQMPLPTPQPPSQPELGMTAQVETPSPAALPPFLRQEPEPAVGEKKIFVARERELAQLDTFLDPILEGQGRVVFVTGEAGSGKTALVYEFAQRIQEQHPNLVFAAGNCNAHTGLGEPYLPFREALNLLAGDVEARWSGGMITRENAGRLWALMPTSVQALVDLGPDLIDSFISGAALVTRATAFAGGRASWLERFKELTARQARQAGGTNVEQSRIFEQYTDVLQALAVQQPLLLLLEDLHWADNSSIALLFHLGRRIGESPILIVGTYRLEDIALGRRGERHPLEPVVNELKYYYGDVWVDLGRTEVIENQRFVDTLLDTEANRLGESFRRALLRHTEGHPLFTIELLRNLQERGDLVQDEEGRWIEGLALNWNALPARVEGVIEERIGRLGKQLREALTVASVEGADFTAEVVAQVQALDERGLIRRLSGELDKQHRLVCATGTQRLGRQRLSLYRFQHNLFQRYLYNGLDEVERAYLHEDVGNVLEALYRDRVGEIAVQLARHFLEAGLDDKALTYLIQAGDAAARQYANTEAVVHYTRGLEIARRVEASSEQLSHLYCNLGRALELNTAYEEALATYEEMEALARKRGDQALELAALLARATLHATFTPFSDLQQAISLSEQALTLARQLGDQAAEAKILWNLMLVYMYNAGDPRTAVIHGEESLAIVRELAPSTSSEQALRESLALVLNDLSIAYISVGQVMPALAAADEARQHFQEAGNLPMLAENYNGAITIHLRAGDLEAALTAAAEGYRISQAIGNLVGQITNVVNKSFVYLERGEFGSILAALEEIIPQAEQVGPFYLFAVHIARAMAYAALGVVEQAVELCRLALARADEISPFWQRWGQAILARLYLLQGDLTEAQVVLKRGAIGLDQETFMWLGGSYAPLAEAELALVTREYEQAITIIDEHIARLRSLGIRGYLPEPLYIKGQALLAQGHPAEAREVLAEARTEAAAINTRRMLWQILAALAEIEARRGNLAEAKNLRTQARAIINFIVDHVGPPELRASFLSLPGIQALIAETNAG